MSEVRKAAILLMSLPEDQAVQLMAKSTSKQVEQVSIEIAKLGRLTGDEQEVVIHEFADANPNSLGLAGGGLDVAKSLDRAVQRNVMHRVIVGEICDGRSWHLYSQRAKARHFIVDRSAQFC